MEALNEALYLVPKFGQNYKFSDEWDGLSINQGEFTLAHLSMQHSQ